MRSWLNLGPPRFVPSRVGVLISLRVSGKHSPKKRIAGETRGVKAQPTLGVAAVHHHRHTIRWEKLRASSKTAQSAIYFPDRRVHPAVLMHKHHSNVRLRKTEPVGREMKERQFLPMAIDQYMMLLTAPARWLF